MKPEKLRRCQLFVDERAIRDARKVLRYAVARWGYSTAVAAWEYWNEMDPGLPTDKFYTALGEYLAREDPYGHLRTTSTWGPSAKDCRHQNLDVADTHFYLRPSDKGRLEDEVDAVLERTRWLREQAPAVARLMNIGIVVGSFCLALFGIAPSAALFGWFSAVPMAFTVAGVLYVAISSGTENGLTM